MQGFRFGISGICLQLDTDAMMTKEKLQTEPEPTSLGLGWC